VFAIAAIALMKESHDGLRGEAQALDALLEELLDHLMVAVEVVVEMVIT